MTRADKLRAMSDEELAEKIAKIMFGTQCFVLRGKCINNAKIVEQVLHALQVPAEERGEENGKTD